ncbi:hypothetical protein BU25DRAFT_408803 [Macroventuria anomochaeta]|uniref:Uncharacterized protein n=1 Tax=Macroventuria anomochaeta TaxID=301207 RepID=A0ACB6S6B2_9PLEO|nr:uncharacterized protein BU25DRAFT_408803 [Macroventuria anomochaeta]KAF2629537.1 hypothetical protein BU25DRAFT_408803 [Macroventuria anomochaeta]
MSSFLLSRLSKAVQDSPMLLVNVMCTAKVDLSAWSAALFFTRSDTTHSYQPVPFLATEFVAISILLSAPPLRCLYQFTFSHSASPPGIHRLPQRSIRPLEVNRTPVLDITAAGLGSDDVRLTRRLTPSITQHEELNAMEQRHSSPSSRGRSPRPSTSRKRSNSVPFIVALGCSTPEARLMMAEGKAAVRNRRRGRQNRPVNEEKYATTFDPRNHLKYLDSSYQENDSPRPQKAKVNHSRHPSDATDKSNSTIVAPTRDCESTGNGAPSPLGDYSANLASFIKAQLMSIPTYTSSPDQISPRSCPDLSFQLRTPPLSPNKVARRPVEAPRVISIPPIRPPMQSAFSAWSSTDGSEDEVPALPEIDQYTQNAVSKTTSNGSTPSLLGYYANSKDSFLFSSTPSEEPHTAKGFQFPNPPALMCSFTEPHSPPHDDDTDYYPSSHSSRPQLTSSSEPSISSSSASASSYFEYKRPVSNLFPPHMKDRIVAAVTPLKGKMLTAISPFEGAALSNVHDVFIESQHRVHVDGMSFDMLRDFIVPTSRVSTPV